MKHIMIFHPLEIFIHKFAHFVSVYITSMHLI
jgi:hypothetical protein